MNQAIHNSQPIHHHTRIKTIALPAEHGSWGLVLEPILLGLLVAPSHHGAILAMAGFAAFLLRHPLKIAITDWRNNKRTPRTRLAQRFAFGYGLLALAGLTVVITSQGIVPLRPLVFALPFLIIFVVYDARNHVRAWQSQVAAPAAFSAIASSIALLAGMPSHIALALWIVLIARSIPAILYVRERLRQRKHRPYQKSLPIGAHIVGLGIVVALVVHGMAPWVAILAFLLLLGRAFYGLSHVSQSLATKTIGFLEMGLGLCTVVLIASGYYWML